MLRHLLLFIPLIHAGITAGQNQLLNVSQARISAQIDVDDGQLEVNESPPIQGSIVRSLSLALENDDLRMSFLLQQGKPADEYRLKMQVTLNGSSVQVYDEDLLGDYLQRFSAAQGGEKSIIWTGILDRYYMFEGSLVITISTELWGKPALPFGVDCDELPTFSSKQKFPYYLAAGVGAATIGISAIISADAQKIYDENYLKQLWEPTAEPFYEDANNKRHTGLILRYAGIAILAGDAALYIYRSIRHRKKMDAYNEFCSGSEISISPLIRRDFLAGSQTGLRLTYIF